MYKVGLVCTIKAKSEDGPGNFYFSYVTRTITKIPLTGKVVWISHKQSGFKPQGFAIQLSGDKGIYYKAEAERILAGSMSLDRPSYTM